MAKVASNLREIRINKAMSQEDVARACDVSLRTVVAAEKGRSISLNTLKHLAKGLKVKTEDLI